MLANRNRQKGYYVCGKFGYCACLKAKSAVKADGRKDENSFYSYWRRRNA